MIRPQTERPDRRRGFSLIEVVVTLAVVVVFLGLGAGLIRLLLRLDAASRDALEVANALTALSRDFRHDVHRAAPDARPSPDGSSLTLSLPEGQSVTYTIRPRDVLRERRGGDGALAHEVYRLAFRATASFERPTGDGRPLLTLVVRPNPKISSKATSMPATRIVAELGRWAASSAGRTP